ncbi:MAG TPA: hypothetical protein VFH36_18650 [Acidimicrobiales bacterium]|nr:hypothetical protein [Acidimicrobiales bacterium]
MVERPVEVAEDRVFERFHLRTVVERAGCAAAVMWSPGPGTVRAVRSGPPVVHCPMTVLLSGIVREVHDLADRPGALSETNEHRWRHLMPHWDALARRINEDTN